MTYTRLFPDDREKLLNLDRVGRGLFNDLQWFIQDAFYVFVGKVLDPAKTAGNVNASFFRHLEILETEGIETDGLEVWVQNIRRLKEGSRQYRNKMVAHTDENHISQPEQLVRLSISEITEALESLQDFIDWAAPYYGFTNGFRCLLKTPPRHADWFHAHLAAIEFENIEVKQAIKKIGTREELDWATKGRGPKRS